MLSYIKTALILVAFAGPLHANAQEQGKAELQLAKIIEVSQGDGAIIREFFGRVAARETVDMAFQVGGQIVELPVVEGEPVAKGDLIARLDVEPFQIAMDQAQEQKQQADRNLDRLNRLSGASVSQAMIDDAQTQANLTAIALRDAERSLRNATLSAPFDALVASRNVANFSTVGAGTPIARLHDMSELHIEIDVPEVLFQRAGSYPDVSIEAEFPAIDQRFPLEIREYKAETSPVGQTFRIIFSMAPPEGRVILPGSSVTVYVTLGGAQPGLTVPGAAVAMTPDGTPQVMVFTPDTDNPDIGTITATTIAITPSDRGDILVTDGIASGTEIIATGAAALRDGDRVRRFSGFAD